MSPRRRTRVDLLALLVGILAAAGASVALWSAFAAVPWGVVLAVPIALVLIGGLGLYLSQNSREGD
ncbi:hypothetical protein [Propionicicella superfundia]|uniref:hypothetical protein n=1 Tax=Propionicicella superfundia TaxID=348582 RepID=UPI000429FB33|nr:hypothetical protein [Propionicicella superfundia]